MASASCRELVPRRIAVGAMKTLRISRPLLFFCVLVSLSSVDIFLARAGILPLASALGVALCFVLVAFWLSVDRLGLMLRVPSGTTRNLRLPAFLYTVFIAWSLLSLVWVHDSSIGTSALLRYAMYPLAMGAIVVAGSHEQMRNTIKCAVVFALGVVTITVLWDFVFPRTFSETLRPAGILGNPNGAAQTVCALLLAVFMADVRGRVIWIAAGVGALAVLVTLSRSGALLLGVVLAIIALGQYGLVNRYGPFKILAGLICFIMFLFLAQEIIGGQENITYANRWNSISTLSGIIDLDDPRIHLIREYLAAWLRHPVMGAGVAASIGFDDGIVGAAHNLYAKVLYESGLVGALLLGMAFSALVLSSFHKRREGRVVTLLCWGFIILWGLFTNTLLDNRLAYYLVLSIGLSSLFSSHEKKQTS